MASMFRQHVGAGLSLLVLRRRGGQLPEQVGGHDAYLITGSASGVYDGDPWIEPLKQFIQQSSGHTPMVGICFGHQVMAEAYGGQRDQIAERVGRRAAQL